MTAAIGWWPTFNVADIYITLGAAAWAISTLRADERSATEGSKLLESRDIRA